jgi:uncharacterized phiE125 gp8 family phage protein
MHRPVLVTAPALMPVSLLEAKEQLAVDADDHDALISGYIAAAVDHLDGWTGILGRALVEQTWRQDFDGFAGVLRLPLAPVISITSIVWRNADGELATVPSDHYTLMVDDLGPLVKFKSRFAAPSSLNETAPVAVTFLAGYPSIAAVRADNDVPEVPAQSTVPAAIKAAILIHVRLMFDAYRLGEGAGPIPMAAIDSLVAPFRRVQF